MSINDTEGGSTTARYRPGDIDEIPIRFTVGLTDKVSGPSFTVIEYDMKYRNLGSEVVKSISTSSNV